MSELPENRDVLCAELNRELPIRRTMTVLQNKRQRVREDLEQLLAHLAFLVPAPAGCDRAATDREVLEAALDRLGDDAFAQLVRQIVDR